jgi:hypothetical protein
MSDDGTMADYYLEQQIGDDMLPTNPCNDCKIEYRHCPLYPKACKRFDEYCEAMNKEAK